MYQSKLFGKRWGGICAGLVLMALVFRVLSSPTALAAVRRSTGRAVRSAEFADLIFSVELGQRVRLARAEVTPSDHTDAARASDETTPAETSRTDEPDVSGETQPAASAANRTDETLQFSAAEADKISIRSRIDESVDKAALLLQPLSLPISGTGPKVLIVHTHSCEAYTATEGNEYTPSGSYRTLDKSCSVIRVGEELRAVLEQNGIETIHDTEYNDYPHYTGGYDRMEETISSYLAQYPSICMVIDLHRDAVADANGNLVGESVTLGGEDYAPLMFVVGTDEGGLYHPNWRGNLSLALKLQALLNREYDGLCRSLSLRKERFNENQTPGSLLIEIGSTENTLEQALRTARVFGQTLASFLLADGE